jgi:trehalose 6-phosphate synthase/phosphatase
MGVFFFSLDMFRALRATSRMPKDDIFTVTVGPRDKATLAAWHVPEPADVIAAIDMLTAEGASSATAA